MDGPDPRVAVVMIAGGPGDSHHARPPAVKGNPAADPTAPPRIPEPGRLLLSCISPKEPRPVEIYASARDFGEGKQSFYLRRWTQPEAEIIYPLHGHFLDGGKRVLGLALLTLVPFFNFHALKFNVNTVLMPVWAATTFFFLRSFETRSTLPAALAGLCAAYTGAANLTGLPAVAIPAGSSDGLPVGVQIVAPAGRDALALRIARALEKTAAEHRVHPPPDGG